MSIVVDANLVAALALPLPYSEQASARMRQWKLADANLLAPILLEYELSSVLRKAVVAGYLEQETAAAALDQLLTLGITTLPPTLSLHHQALLWAERLGHSKSYDAHYLAVAEQNGAEFWTADQRLVNTARKLGLAWVHGIFDN